MLNHGCTVCIRMAGVRCRGEAFGEEVVVYPLPAGSCGLKGFHWEPTAAYRRASVTSASSSSGSSARISVDVIWSATIATTVATGMRKPRMHGMPPITSGSMVTRVTRMSIRLAGDSTLGRFSTSRLGLSSAKSKPEGDFGTACGAVSGGDAGVVALAEGVDDGQSKPGAAGGARGVGGFRESRADCGEQFGVASWTPQGEFEFGGQEAKGVRSSWPASLTN